MLFGEKGDLIGRLWKNKLAKGCLVSAFVWFFFRYLFSLAAPFFLAFALITLLYPLLERIQKRIPIKKKFLAAGIVLPVLFLVCAGLWAVLAFGMGQLQGLPAFCEKVERQAALFFHQCCCQLDGRFGWKGEQIESYVIEQMTVIMENVQIQVVPQLLSSSYSCFKGILEVVGFLFGMYAETGDVEPVCGSMHVLLCSGQNDAFPDADSSQSGFRVRFCNRFDFEWKGYMDSFGVLFIVLPFSVCKEKQTLSGGTNVSGWTSGSVCGGGSCDNHGGAYCPAEQRSLVGRAWRDAQHGVLF